MIGGVGAVEREILRNQDNRVSACIGLVSVEITNRMKEGGLRVPPPIQTRMYQELSNGVMGFSQAFPSKHFHRTFDRTRSKRVYRLAGAQDLPHAP